MIRLTRTGQTTTDKFAEGVQFAKEIAAYLNANFGTSVQVFTQLFGDLSTIYWYSDYKDLATLESTRAKYLADPGYWAILHKAAGIFIDGGLRDSLAGSV